MKTTKTTKTTKTILSAFVIGSMLATGVVASASSFKGFKKTTVFSKKIVRSSHARVSGKKGYYDPEIYQDPTWGHGRPKPWQRPIPFGGREY